jgi:sulfur-carrier protein adenylyltransferase/sulfurtransferase
MKIISNSEKEYYARQILAYGISFQEKLKNSHVLIIGAGGLGNALLPVLAASGIGTLSIYDGDTIEKSNLSRQMLYTENDLGLPKVEVCKHKIHQLNRFVEVKAYNHHFRYQIDKDEKPDMIVDGSDSLETKFQTSEFCFDRKLPCIIGSVSIEQQHIHYFKDSGKSCYRCIFKKLPANDILDCKSTGIQSSTVHLCGSFMANLVINHFKGNISSGSFFVNRGDNWTKKIYGSQDSCPVHKKELLYNSP